MKVAAFLVVVGLAAAAAAADKPANDQVKAEETWRLMVEPHLKRTGLSRTRLQRSVTASAKEQAQIKQHIASLEKIDRPDFGLSATMSGTAFAPVRGSQKSGAFLITNHQLETTEDFKQLVAFGPRALPFLLEALDDSRPTKLTQRHNPDFGGMWLSMEMGFNPINSIERQAVSPLPKSS